tara:strand:- start:121 stop:345 length:225 start_codon:yes stop_codon:yes gene_type:complete
MLFVFYSLYNFIYNYLKYHLADFCVIQFHILLSIYFDEKKEPKKEINTIVLLEFQEDDGKSGLPVINNNVITQM